jgi:hypothetical protein
VLVLITRDNYLHNLEHSGYAENPTLEQIMGVCPHMTNNEIKQLIDTCDETGRTAYLATPPLMVASEYHIVSYIPIGIRDDQHSHLTVSYNIGKMKDCEQNPSNSYPYAIRAMEYAKQNWSENLTENISSNFGTFIIKDPKCHWYPKTKFVIYVSLNQTWKNILNDHDKPSWKALDDAIADITFNYFEGIELRCDRDREWRFFCSRCGHGFSLNICTGCGEWFDDDQQHMYGYPFPMPPKLVNILFEKGHKFDLDPNLFY